MVGKNAGGSRRRGGLNPNDRKVDQRAAKAVKRVKLEELDAMLRNGEDE